MIDFLTELGIAVGFGFGLTCALFALLLFYQIFIVDKKVFNTPIIMMILASLLLFVGSSILYFILP